MFDCFPSQTNSEHYSPILTLNNTFVNQMCQILNTVYLNAISLCANKLELCHSYNLGIFNLFSLDYRALNKD